MDNFQEIKKRSLELVPKLVPSFEEDKEETTQAESERKSELEGKKEQQANPKTIKNLKTWLKASQGLWSETIGPLILLNRSCTQHIANSFWRMEFVQDVEKLENGQKKET